MHRATTQLVTQPFNINSDATEIFCYICIGMTMDVENYQENKLGQTMYDSLQRPGLQLKRSL